MKTLKETLETQIKSVIAEIKASHFDEALLKIVDIKATGQLITEYTFAIEQLEKMADDEKRKADIRKGNPNATLEDCIKEALGNNYQPKPAEQPTPPLANNPGRGLKGIGGKIANKVFGQSGQQ